MVNNKCAIWPDFYATCTPIDDSGSYCIESARAGGKYEISSEVAGLIKELEDEEKVRLTTWLLDQQLQGVRQPKVTEEIINYVKTKRPLSVPERADRLLRFIVTETDRIGNRVAFLVEDRNNIMTSPYLTRKNDLKDKKQKNTYLAYAWSESTDWEEIEYYFSYMIKKGWLESSHPSVNPDSGETGNANQIPVTVTIDGYSRIEDQITKTDSAQVFVAMWFGDEMKKVYEKGIKPAIEDAGFKPMRIDQKPDLDKIDDEIIGEIR